VTRPGPQTGSIAATGTTPTADDDHTVLHRGRAFQVGETAESYGVWDAARGTAVARLARTPEGWQAAWRRFAELEASSSGPEPPVWRAARPGWILLHIVIGLAIGTLAVVLAMAMAAAGGRDVAPLTAQTAVASSVAFLGGLVGWILFVYMRTSVGLRWLWFAVAVGISFLLALGTGLASQPPA
jgi:hypothetical protein